MKKILLPLLTLALLAACNTGRIRTPNGVMLNSPKDASAPSSVKEGQRAVRTVIPAGTTVVRETVAATAESPAIERETTSYTQPAEKVETETMTDISVAAPRAPDQAVALHSIDVASKRPLLIAVIVATFIAGLALYRGKLDLAAVAGSIAAAMALLWWALGNPFVMVTALVLVACGVGFYIWSRHKSAAKTEEALRRQVQSVEELKIDNPSVAKELKEYNDANMDSEHKAIIQAIKPTINDKYLRGQLALRYIDSK
jgi:hypothetical protein